jgi:hypothetical protein
VNIVILNCQRPLWEKDWEGNQEVVKRSGRDEPMWVAIHKCMKAILGTSLSAELSLSQTSKNAISFLLSLMFSLQQNWRRRGWNRVCPDAGGWGRGEGGSGTNNVCTCK